jgi:hypothetical protein
MTSTPKGEPAQSHTTPEPVVQQEGIAARNDKGDPPTLLRQEPDDHIAANTPTDGEARTPEKKPWWERANWDAVSGIINGVIALFTFVAVVGLVVQIYQSRRDVRLDKRAWLGVRTLQQIASGDSVAFRNYGATPARNAHFSIELAIVTSPGECRLSIPTKPIGGSKTVVFPDQDHYVPINDYRPLVRASKDALAAFQDGKATMCVYGWTTYDDIFGESHKSGFCLFGQMAPGARDWTPISCPNGDYVD